MIYAYRHKIAPDTDVTKQLERSRPRREKQQEIIKSILLVGSDFQSVLGIALVISGLIQSTVLDLYHFHILYDLVNFTAYVFQILLLPYSCISPLDKSLTYNLI